MSEKQSEQKEDQAPDQKVDQKKDDDWNSVNQPEHNPEDDYEEASRSTADYANYEPPEKKRNPVWHKLFTIFIILVVIAGLGGGAYWYLKNHKSAKKPATSAQTSQTVKPATSQIATVTKHYDSSNFYLGFDYPQDWKVTDSGGGQMTIVSPSIQLKSASGQSVNGQIVMTIRSKEQKLPEFDSGNATAALASQKINYTKPSQNQRGSTYISYLRYASSTSSTALDGIYITGDSGYTVGQAIPKVDISKVDPIISIGFVKCNSSDCSGINAVVSIAASSFEDKTFSGPLESLFKSLAIQ
ncbi:hypothetical protein COU91_02460 [Candidatus Saccharibacteria bacterium CG10_big_fil_rev_8_21_14_0_10_47_8]|nr:MAG: hypothetical protein COU91_02460 [Candidatus Saccharibacteria bacterium CG10_big_fil_rev_8_21_14_0_10_47_8]